MSNSKLIEKLLDYSHNIQKNGLCDRAFPFFNFGRQNMVYYTRETNNDSQAGCIQALKPLKTLQIPYFQIKIVQIGENSLLRIALAPQKCRLQAWPGQSQPGLSLKLDSYMVIDKKLIEFPQKIKIKKDDIVGIGIDLIQQCIIISVNGNIQTAKPKVNYIRLISMYPTVAFSKKNQCVQFIFTDFKCKIKEHMEQSLYKIFKLPCEQQQDMPEIISDFLFNSGMTETLKQFKEQAQLQYEPKFRLSHQNKNIVKANQNNNIKDFLQKCINIEQIGEDKLKIFANHATIPKYTSQQVVEQIMLLRDRIQQLILKEQYKKVISKINQIQKYSQAIQLKANIVARQFVKLIKMGQINQAVNYGRQNLIAHKNNKFYYINNQKIQTLSFQQVAAHISGQGPLIQQNNFIILKTLLNKQILKQHDIETKSKLELQLEEIQNLNRLLKRDNIPLPKIKYDLQ